MVPPASAEYRDMGNPLAPCGRYLRREPMRMRRSLDLHRMPKAERQRGVQEELHGVGLAGLEDRYPHQFSGGQQRLAIVRSLAVRPRALLMDEPFSDLDAGTRQQVRDEVLRILRARGMSALIATHDHGDAYHMADRIAEMGQGRIIRSGTAADFKHHWAGQHFEP